MANLGSTVRTIIDRKKSFDTMMSQFDTTVTPKPAAPSPPVTAGQDFTYNPPADSNYRKNELRKK